MLIRKINIFFDVGFHKGETSYLANKFLRKIDEQHKTTMFSPIFQVSSKITIALDPLLIAPPNCTKIAAWPAGRPTVRSLL